MSLPERFNAAAFVVVMDRGRPSGSTGAPKGPTIQRVHLRTGA
jgi:hypothetical protein